MIGLIVNEKPLLLQGFFSFIELRINDYSFWVYMYNLISNKRDTPVSNKY